MSGLKRGSLMGSSSPMAADLPIHHGQLGESTHPHHIPTTSALARSAGYMRVPAPTSIPCGDGNSRGEGGEGNEPCACGADRALRRRAVRIFGNVAPSRHFLVSGLDRRLWVTPAPARAATPPTASRPKSVILSLDTAMQSARIRGTC